MKRLYHIQRILLLLAILLGTTGMAHAETTGGQEEGGVDVKEIVLGHLSDAYEWHILSTPGKHITLPLPVIVKSHDGTWHTFSSSRLSHGIRYNGFYIDEERNGKIYEELPDGQTERPLDLSITKDVVQIGIVMIIMLSLFLGCARWYRGRSAADDAPKGLVGTVEMMVMSIYDDVIKPGVGVERAPKYGPFLLTAFFFIFITNLLGLIPIFPGGANVTGNISITLLLALLVMLAINLFGNREYWRETFWPEVPVWLKVPIPLMPVIEIFGIFIKPFALMIRLFANMMGGHATILSLTCVIFITCQIGVAIGASLSLVSFLLMIFMNALELLVAFIQAYVFTMLSAVFIGMAHPQGHHS
jgi:F-type H+-transporting ATPase subunit a